MRVRTAVTGLAGTAAMIALVTVASRLVGFLRWLAMAHEVGPNSFGGAYTSANTLPNVVFEVAAGGALASAVVPLLAVPLAHAIRRDVDRTASALLGWTLVILVPLAAAVGFLSRPVVGLVMPGATAGELEVAASFLTMFAPQLPLYGIGLVLTGVLQAHRRFLWPALAPLLNSLVVIAVFGIFGQMVPDPQGDPTAVSRAAVALLGWGTTAGVAVMSLPLLWPVHRVGVRLRPALRFPPGVAARARSLALAGVGALVAQQVSVVATLALANRFGQNGTWPVFQYTQAVYVLPYAVLAFPLATATLPRLAEHAARDDHERFGTLAALTTRTVVAVSILGAAVLVAIAPAVEQVFAHVAEGDVTGMGSALAAMAPGLLGFALILHLSRALYALDRGRAAVIATSAGWLAVAASAALLVPALTGGDRDQFDTLRGLAIATSLGMTVAGGALLIALVRSAGRTAVVGVPRTTAALALGGAGGAVVGRVCVTAIGADGVATALVAGVVGTLACAVVVLVAAWAMDRTVLRALRGSRLADAVPESWPSDGTPVG